MKLERKSRTQLYPRSHRGSCLSRECHLHKGFVARMKFGKFVFSGVPRPWTLLLQLCSTSLPSLLCLYACCLPFLFHFFFFFLCSAYFTLRNHHGLRIFSITQKPFHYYASRPDSNRICMAFQMKVNLKNFLPFPHVKTEGCREGWKTWVLLI